jgi:hypothetical protein
MTPRCGTALMSAMFVAFAAGCANQPLQFEPAAAARSCPGVSSPDTPWVAVISRPQPLAVQMKVRGDYDPGSAGMLIAERGGRAAGKWISEGLVLGGAISGDVMPIAGSLVFLASFVTAPFALVAGAMEGASDAAAYSRRHAAAGRQFEQELGGEALQADLARSVVDTLGPVASAPVHVVDGGSFSPSTLLVRCGAVVALELEFDRVEFEAPSVIEFVARPSLTARYRMSEAGSDHTPVSGTAQVTGRYYKFASIEQDGARPLRDEVVAALDALSGRILAALPSTVAWTRLADTKLATNAVQVSTLYENLHEPLRVHPDLLRPSQPARLAAISTPNLPD